MLVVMLCCISIVAGWISTTLVDSVDYTKLMSKGRKSID